MTMEYQKQLSVELKLPQSVNSNKRLPETFRTQTEATAELLNFTSLLGLFKLIKDTVNVPDKLDTTV